MGYKINFKKNEKDEMESPGLTNPADSAIINFKVNYFKVNYLKGEL